MPAKGTLIIIGGHEDKYDKQCILTTVAQNANSIGRLVIVTTATQHPEEVAAEYKRVFQALGVKDIGVLDIRNRQDAFADKNVGVLEDATVIFFTGGDQLRVTSQLSGSPVFKKIQALYEAGAVIVGTSAGAAAMPVTMLVSGANDASARIGAIDMAPGMGLITDVVIDSHFAERGRIGRLLGAIACNPAHLGIGIDEDTAIVVQQTRRFRVIGSGAVYVVDGMGLTYSNLADQYEGTLSIYDVKLHVLTQDYEFDLVKRQPISPQKA